MKNKRIFFFASGGTLGHLKPSIELAKKIKNNFNFVYFITTNNNLDVKNIYENNFCFLNFNIKKMTKISFFNFFLNSFFLFIYFFYSIFLIIFLKPNILISFGSYISFPMSLISFFLGKKVYIFEQNILLGISNIISSFYSNRIYIHFYCNYFSFFLYKVFYFLNPLEKKYYDFFLFSGIKKKTNKILLVGGTNGAEFINNFILSIFYSNCSLFFFNYILINQYGKKKRDIRKFKINFIYKNYIINIFNYFGNFDFIISRSGAGFCREILEISVPVILIPYKDSIFNHQFFNSIYYSRKKNFFFFEELEIKDKIIINFLNFFFSNIKFYYEEKLISENLLF